MCQRAVVLASYLAEIVNGQVAAADKDRDEQLVASNLQLIAVSVVIGAEPGVLAAVSPRDRHACLTHPRVCRLLTGHAALAHGTSRVVALRAVQGGLYASPGKYSRH